MIWTKEKPKEPGWYWISFTYNPGGIDSLRWKQVAEVVCVGNQGSGRSRLGFFNEWKNYAKSSHFSKYEFMYLDDKDCNYDFSSEPIQEPNE